MSRLRLRLLLSPGAQPIRTLLQAGVDLVIPAICPRCQLQEIDPSLAGMCDDCRQALVQPVDWLCQCCGAFSHPYSHYDGRCSDCRHVRHRFDMAIALGAYDGELRHTIVRMKQAMEQSLTFTMGQLLADRAITLMAEDTPDMVCSVPMHWLRRLSRRTSSAHTLAVSVAKRIHVPHQHRLLSCARQTQKQSLLNHDARRQNVSGAFLVRHPTLIQDQHVGVVDDIMTTGATMTEIARTLKNQGARRVTAMVVARANRQSMIVRKSPKSPC